jgi:hypothetical protein
VPVTEPEPHRHRAAPRQEIDPAMHLAVLATAMREQGFGDRSIARVQQRAERLLVAFGKDGTPVPTPKVFDPKAPSARDQRRRSSPERDQAPEIDRTLTGPSPLSPSRLGESWSCARDCVLNSGRSDWAGTTGAPDAA